MPVFELTLVDTHAHLTEPSFDRDRVEVLEKARRAGVRAIVSSGYSTDPVMSNCTEYGFTGVVKKPFKIEEVDEVLDQTLKK